MKSLLLFLGLVFTGFILSAQNPVTKGVGDTLGPWSVISFEEPTDFIHINPSSGNIWQTGTPTKTFFNQAYTVPNAMVTDTLNAYPVNNLSTFDLHIGNFNSFWYPYNIFIDFRHKIDADTLHDGGYITVSWDNGQTWMNILKDTNSLMYFFATPARTWGMWGNTNLYSPGDTLFNGEPGFSGKSDGWVHSCMAWYDLPVNKTINFPPDTMILRFNFISDNNNSNKEGWMIDQIRLFSIDLGSGTRDIRDNPVIVSINPNPIRATSMVTLKKEFKVVEYSVYSTIGTRVLSGKWNNCSSFAIERKNLPSGFYLLQVSCDDHLISKERLLVF